MTPTAAERAAQREWLVARTRARLVRLQGICQRSMATLEAAQARLYPSRPGRRW
jgi:hypothetical protein